MAPIQLASASFMGASSYKMIKIAEIQINAKCSHL